MLFYKLKVLTLLMLCCIFNVAAATGDVHLEGLQNDTSESMQANDSVIESVTSNINIPKELNGIKGENNQNESRTSTIPDITSTSRYDDTQTINNDITDSPSAIDVTMSSSGRSNNDIITDVADDTANYTRSTKAYVSSEKGVNIKSPQEKLHYRTTTEYSNNFLQNNVHSQEKINILSPPSSHIQIVIYSFIPIAVACISIIILTAVLLRRRKMRKQQKLMMNIDFNRFDLRSLRHESSHVTFADFPMKAEDWFDVKPANNAVL